MPWLPVISMCTVRWLYWEADELEKLSKATGGTRSSRLFAVDIIQGGVPETRESDMPPEIMVFTTYIQIPTAKLKYSHEGA